MRPDDHGVPEAWQAYEHSLGLTVTPLPRADFYAACLSPTLAVCVATGDTRFYANLLLTIGAISK
ncbi:RbsD/FucU domain-containing protein [Actinokineospora soli]|uniref:D-ribose pyranase n=1 Tax=Actinokineospora soli TaxID=1048753 RepID=A0ABW2TPA6_9PSEU